MSKTKILCIDDTPDQKIEGSNQSLRQIVEDIYKTSSYKVIFETDGEKGIGLTTDNNIKLVLLDIEFTRQEKQGDKIAKALIKGRPELKVIVLSRDSRTGTKISLGHKRNVVHYVVKKELSSTDTQRKLKNLSQAVIKDYENKGWHLEYDGMETITLSMGEKSFGINIPITAKQAIHDCISSPNKPVSIILASDQLNKAHNMINNNVREGTDWNTWGILTKEGCAKGQLKLVIGSISIVPLKTSRTPKDPYILQSQFEKFKKDIEERLALIEKALNFKSPQKIK